MNEKGSQDPGLDHPGPKIPQADDGGLSMGMHRQSEHWGEPGFRTQDRMHGIGPSRLPVDGFQRERLLDNRQENCTTLFQNGNCNGDPYWMAASGDWYNYPGIGGSPGARSGGTIMAQSTPNNPGYHFPSSTSDTDLSEFVTSIYGPYAVASTTPLEVIKNRPVQNCNCGTGGFGDDGYNCYSNCNCNCQNCQNCNCSDCSCFPAGTPVTMADGTQRLIEDLRPGDQVRGAFGIINQVDAIYVGPIGDHSAFLINGEFFVPGGHRLWSLDRGWVAADPPDWYAAMRAPGSLARFAEVHGVKTPPIDGIYAPESERPKQMAIGDRLAWQNAETAIIVESILPVHHDGQITLYEPICHNGSGSYEVHGGLWAVAGPDYSFPFQDYVRKDSHHDHRSDS